MSLESRAAARFTSVAVAASRRDAGDECAPEIRTSCDAPASNGAGRGGAVAAVAAEIAGVLTDELDRCHADWQRMFATLHETLSPLTRLCETASQKRPPRRVADLPVLVDRLTAAAAFEAEAAASQAHAAVERRAADAEAALGRIERELQSARARLQASEEERERERSAWAGVQAAWEKARRDDQQAASAWRAQLEDAHAELETTRGEFALLAQQLETERAERVKLAAALDAVQRALRFAEHRRGAAQEAGDEAILLGAESTGEAPAGVEASPLPPRMETPTLVHHPPLAEADDGPELAEYARELLWAAEAAYRADVEASLSPIMALDRLTDHLRGARDRFASRASVPDGDPQLFKRHLLALLDSRWDTAFGRHLGMAIYQLYPTLSKPA